MQAIHTENVPWVTKERGVKEAELFSVSHGTEETRIDLVEVPPGSFIPANRHSQRREFFTILLSAGAQLRIGERVFRPTAGQIFHREPEDVMACTNDTQHVFRYSVTRFRYEASDIEWVNSKKEAEA